MQEKIRRRTYWQNELKSLGVEPKNMNELNDKGELRALTDNIKRAYFQNYKNAYEDRDNIDDPRLDFLI